MKRISPWVMFALLFFCGYGVTATAVATTKSYETKKLAYQKVIESQDLEALNHFIEEYKDTGWEKSALWHRDKLIVNIAKKDGSVGALNDFLETYPNSAWYSHALHFRDKSAYRQAKMINEIEIYDDFLHLYPGSQWQEKVKKLKARLLSSKHGQSKKSHSKSNAPEVLPPINLDKIESAEVRRNNAALAIYDDIRQQKNKAEKDKQNKKQKRLALKRYCHKVQDQLRRIDEGRRWYKLNDQGKRKYLTDAQIDQERLILFNKGNKKCDLKAS